MQEMFYWRRYEWIKWKAKSVEYFKYHINYVCERKSNVLDWQEKVSFINVYLLRYKSGRSKASQRQNKKNDCN